MRKGLPVFLTALLFSLSFLPSYGVTAAVGGPSAPKTCQSNDLGDLERCIAELEKRIREKQSQERSLQNEIDSLDDQINLTESKIRQAQAEILKKEGELTLLAGDIDSLSARIEKLGEAITYQTILLNERVRERYINGTVSPLEFIFGNSLNDIAQNSQFIKVIEDRDTRLIKKLNVTKQNYTEQKDALEEKKAKVEDLKRTVEVDRAKSLSLKAGLVDQRSEKDVLLSQTKGDEAVYQELLRQARAEMDAINGVASSANFSNGESVDEGDVVAIMGNSGYPGCSTGPHLHFEVRKNGSIVNAESYLKPQTMYVSDYSSGYKRIGSGSWNWPMRSPEVTQRYGRTPWSYRYPSGTHSGIDMISSNTNIYAPKAGKYIRGSVGCYGSGMNYAAIDHGSGLVTYYFHIR